jgi:aminoglycoside phosphotransferase (APT) family kinase protein
MRALQDTDVPMARAVALCGDEWLIGGPFAISSFVAGGAIAPVDEVAPWMSTSSRGL